MIMTRLFTPGPWVSTINHEIRAPFASGEAASPVSIGILAGAHQSQSTNHNPACLDPELCGNVALVVRSPQMFELLNHIDRCLDLGCIDGNSLVHHSIKRLLENVRAGH